MTDPPRSDRVLPLAGRLQQPDPNVSAPTLAWILPIPWPPEGPTHHLSHFTHPRNPSLLSSRQFKGHLLGEFSLPPPSPRQPWYLIQTPPRPSYLTGLASLTKAGSSLKAKAALSCHQVTAYSRAEHTFPQNLSRPGDAREPNSAHTTFAAGAPTGRKRTSVHGHDGSVLRSSGLGW